MIKPLLMPPSFLLLCRFFIILKCAQFCLMDNILIDGSSTESKHCDATCSKEDTRTISFLIKIHLFGVKKIFKKLIINKFF